MAEKRGTGEAKDPRTDTSVPPSWTSPRPNPNEKTQSVPVPNSDSQPEQMTRKPVRWRMLVAFLALLGLSAAVLVVFLPIATGRPFHFPGFPLPAIKNVPAQLKRLRIEDLPDPAMVAKADLTRLQQEQQQERLKGCILSGTAIVDEVAQLHDIGGPWHYGIILHVNEPPRLWSLQKGISAIEVQQMLPGAVWEWLSPDGSLLKYKDCEVKLDGFGRVESWKMLDGAKEHVVQIPSKVRRYTLYVFTNQQGLGGVRKAQEFQFSGEIIQVSDSFDQLWLEGPKQEPRQ